MDHEDHVRLIRDGVAGAGRRWLELGAGRGAFTLALADLLAPGGEIVAVDRNAGDLRELASTMATRFPATGLHTVNADFTAPMSTEGPPFDGLLAANALHFVRDPAAVIDRLRRILRPAARVIVVEYDSDRGNAWVPHPFSYGRWEAMASDAGLADTRLIGRVPSRFLGAIYAAASEVRSAATSPENEVGQAAPAEIAASTASRPVLHSRPHGEDREE
jgi:ubiquinone/menaquinone biosynthesis C-methylase UbiE